MGEHARVILNPNAGKRLGQQHWPLIQQLLAEAQVECSVAFTAGRMDASRLAREAVREGIRHIILVGGDGTLNEAVHGIMQEAGNAAREIVVSLIPVGTGNDWTRMYGIPHEYRAAIGVIAAGRTLLQDVGCVTYSSPSGREERYFLNAAGVGMDAEVIRDTNRKKDLGGGGKIDYLKALLVAVFKYKPKRSRVSIDGQEVFSGLLYSANVGVCRYSGGGMQQVPNALPDDGLFDVTIIRDLSLWRVISNVKGLFDGSFIRMKEVSTYRAVTVEIKAEDTLLLEVDGESLGTPTFGFNIFPQAIRVSVPLAYSRAALEQVE